MKKPVSGVLFVLTWSLVSKYLFALDGRQLISLVLLYAMATYLHLKQIEYLPKIRFSLAMIVIIPLISPYGAPLAVSSALVMVVFSAVISQSGWKSLVRNYVNYGASALLASWVFGRFGGEVGYLPLPQSLGPLVLSGGAYAVINLFTSSLFAAFQQQSDWPTTFRKVVAGTWTNYLLVIYVGAMLAAFTYALGLSGLILLGGLVVGLSELLQINTRMHYERNRRLRVEAELSMDPKTRVHNWRHLHDWLSDQTTPPAAILFIDIDDFKEFNDQYGHEKGDTALAVTAQAIKKTLRDIDQVIRFGGEEFVVILPEADGAAALSTAERIRREVTEAAQTKLRISLTVSIGAVGFAETVDKHDLVVLADRAMYQAKSLGKNRCFLWDSGTSGSLHLVENRT